MRIDGEPGHRLVAQTFIKRVALTGGLEHTALDIGDIVSPGQRVAGHELGDSQASVNRQRPDAVESNDAVGGHGCGRCHRLPVKIADPGYEGVLPGGFRVIHSLRDRERKAKDVRDQVTEREPRLGVPDAPAFDRRQRARDRKDLFGEHARAMGAAAKTATLKRPPRGADNARVEHVVAYPERPVEPAGRVEHLGDHDAAIQLRKVRRYRLAEHGEIEDGGLNSGACQKDSGALPRLTLFGCQRVALDGSPKIAIHRLEVPHRGD